MSELDVGGCAGLYKSGFAGDVLNTLFYTSRLGMKTGLISSIGTDHFTRDIVSLLQREEIDLEIVPVLKERPNGLYITKLTGDVGVEGALRQFSFWRNNSAARETFVRRPLPAIREYSLRATYFHLSAIAVAILKERERLLELLASIASAVTVSFDTNVRPSLWDSLEELKELLPLLARFTQILFVTDTDDRALFGARAFTEAIDTYLAMGFPLVVYRRGALGCEVATRDIMFHSPAVEGLHVVDSTGAGDAFNAGFLYAQKNAFSIEDSARMGNAVAACVLESYGGVNPDFTKQLAQAYFEHLKMEATPSR
jgi:2-dehydro-3-deoxygluconokinase